MRDPHGAVLQGVHGVLVGYRLGVVPAVLVDRGVVAGDRWVLRVSDFALDMVARQTGERLDALDGGPVSYTHLRAHETRHDLVCRLLLEKKKKTKKKKV